MAWADVICVRRATAQVCGRGRAHLVSLFVSYMYMYIYICHNT